MESRGIHRVGNREERLYAGASYGDVLQGDTLFVQRTGWHHVLTIDPAGNQMLRIRLMPQLAPGQTGTPGDIIVSPSELLTTHLRRPIGCIDDQLEDTVRSVLLADWGEPDQMLHAVQVRIANTWERHVAGLGGRNWVTRRQAGDLYRAVHAEPDMPIRMLLEKVGITVLHVPPTVPEAARNSELVKVACEVAEALENLAGHGAVRAYQLNNLALTLRDAVAKYENGAVA